MGVVGFEKVDGEGLGALWSARVAAEVVLGSCLMVDVRAKGRRRMNAMVVVAVE